MQIEWSLVNTLLNIVLVVGGGVLTHYLRGVDSRVIELRSEDAKLANALQAKDIELTRRMTSIELLIAGQYVTRGEFRDSLKELSDALFRKLDAIDLKLDGKADKA